MYSNICVKCAWEFVCVESYCMFDCEQIVHIVYHCSFLRIQTSFTLLIKNIVMLWKRCSQSCT